MDDDGFDEAYGDMGDMGDFLGEVGPSALTLGTGYALYRHGQDRQTAQLIDAIKSRSGDGDEDDMYHHHAPVVHVHTGEDERGVAPVNVLDYVTADMPDGWDDYVGQGPLKRQMEVYIKSALARDATLPHTLLASGMPGVGKTAMARLIAKTMDRQIVELVPPFNIYTLVEAIQQVDDGDFVFLDEIHKLADSGKRGAEILLKILEEHIAFLPDGEVVELPEVTIIGATTDRDKLPEPVVDRFKIKPYFQPYSLSDLARITVQFARRHDATNYVDDWLCANIAAACRGTPRITEEMVLAARDLALAYGRNPAPQELLDFLEVEPDGLTRTHIHYLTAMRQYFRRESKEGEVEYIVGEAAIQQILRETKQGIGRVERFLVERGLVDRTPRGRRLTPVGIMRAEEFIRAGKGASDVA